MTTKNQPLGLAEINRLLAPLKSFSSAGIAVSGGPDSTALMLMAAQWREQLAVGVDSRKSAPALIVLTFDHGLRSEAAEETAWVSVQAEKLGLACVVLRYAGPLPQTALQEAARNARYAAMTGYCRENGIDCLLTAHHLEDQAETLLMRLARGSGVDGLAAMHERSDRDGMVLLRPLLAVPKARLRATLEAASMTWLEDPSNEETAFERVRLRRSMPALEEAGLTVEALALTAERMQRAHTALEAAVAEFIAAHVQAFEAGWCRIERAAFFELPDETGLRVLGRVLNAVGGAARSPRLVKLEELCGRLGKDPQTAQTLAGCLVEPGKDRLCVLREYGRMENRPAILQPGEGALLWDNRYRVSIAMEFQGPLYVRPLGPDGCATVRAALDKTPELPGNPPFGKTAPGLISFWGADRLLAVPHLGFYENSAMRDQLQVEYLNRSLGVPQVGTPR